MVDPAKKRRITRRRLIAGPAPEAMRDSQPLVALSPLLDYIGRMGVGVSVREKDRDVYVSGKYSRLMAQGQEPLLEDTIDMAFEESSVELRLLSLDEHNERLVNLTKMAMIGEIAAGLAHDFRNTLMVMKGNFPSLREAAPDGRDCDGRSVDDIILEMDRAADVANEMCRRVLGIGVRCRERMLVSDDLKPPVESTVEMAKIKIKEASAEGRHITIDTSVTDPLYAWMVPSEVQMAVLNILYNAIRCCGKGKEGIITIYGFRNGGKVLLSIGNNGPPIAEEIRDTLLKEPLTKACENGYGLFTAAMNLRSFGGDLTFVSTPERTVFRITLEAAEERDCVKKTRS